MKGNRLGLVLGIMGAIAVILGAFGAHALKDALPFDKIATYKTGVSYHFYHVLAMIGAFLMIDEKQGWARRSFFFFVVGIFLFSGSLYLLATRELIGLDNYKWLGPLTPIGGVSFILGWICLGLAANNRNS